MKRQLSDEEKELIQAHLDKWAEKNEVILKEQKAVQADLTLYKWIFRGIVAFLLGGSIAGILTIPAWVDQRIVERAQAIDDLIIANGDLQAGSYRSAFRDMASFIGRLPESSKEPLNLAHLSDAQKEFFFSTLIGALALNSDKDPTALNEFQGKDRWKALLSNPDFKRLFPGDRRGFSNSSSLNVFMGYAYLRYADNKSDLNQALSYLHEGNTARRDPGSTPSFALLDEALTALLLDQRDKALDALTNYGVRRTVLPYALTFGTPSADQFLSEFDLAIFQRLSQKLSKDNFEDEVCRLFQDVFVAEITINIPDLQSGERRGRFLEQAIKEYGQLKEFRANHDYAAIRTAMNLPEPSANSVDAANHSLDQLFDHRLQLDADKIKASIYLAYHVADTSQIYVRFYTETGANGSKTRGFCQGKPPNSNSEEFWLAYKMRSSDSDWKWSPAIAPEQ